MLTEICAEIRNYFSKEEDRHFGTFKIESGIIVPLLINADCEYVRICGSRKNDGVHKLSDNDLDDEGEFKGAIWEMYPPKAFLALATEIEAWQTANGSVTSQAMSPYTSESFGGYTYSKAGPGNSASGNGSGWADAYAGRLNIYRKIRVV